MQKTPHHAAISLIFLASGVTSLVACKPPPSADSTTSDKAAAADTKGFAGTASTGRAPAEAEPREDGPKPQESLVVKRDGKRLPTVYALARPMYNGELEVALWTEPASCRDFGDGDFASMELGWRLTDGGQFERLLVKRSFMFMQHMTATYEVNASGSQEPGGTFSFDADFEAAGPMDEDHLLSVKGRVSTEVCPPVPPEYPTEAEKTIGRDLAALLASKAPEGQATISVDGHRLPLRSACLAPSDEETRLTLSTAEKCGDDGVFSVELTVRNEAPTKLDRVMLTGRAFGTGRGGGFSTDAFEDATLNIESLPLAAGDTSFDLKLPLFGHQLEVTGKVPVAGAQ